MEMKRSATEKITLMRIVSVLSNNWIRSSSCVTRSHDYDVIEIKQYN